MAKIKDRRIIRRKRRISLDLKGNERLPRISIFRSNRYIYVQAIDDEKRKTLASFSSSRLGREKDYKKAKKTEEAKATGLKLAAILKEKKLLSAVFDRGRYAYNGRVKAVAEGLREGGIKI